MIFLKNKSALYILLSLLLIFIIGGLGFSYFTYSKFSKINETIINEIDNGTALSGSRAQKIIGGYKTFTDGGNVDIVQTKFDLFKPKYSFIWDGSKLTPKSSDVTVQVVQLKRDSIFQDFEIENYSSAYISNKSFDDVKILVRNKDLSTSNSDSGNIKTSPAPSREELERQKESQQKKDEEIKTLKVEVDKYNLDLDKLKKGALKNQDKVDFCKKPNPNVNYYLNTVTGSQSEIEAKNGKINAELDQIMELCK